LKDFFISYNKADRAWAEWIAWQLEEAGYSTEIQAWDFRPGSNFVLEMHRASQEAERTVAVLSLDYLQALYTQPEWAAAFAQDPKGEKQVLLPVRVEECEFRGLLGQVIYIDLVGREEDTARDELLKGVSSDRAKPDNPPSFPGAFPHSLPERPPFPGVSASIRSHTFPTSWLGKLWNGLTESRIKRLAFIGAFIAGVFVISWQVYTHFSKPETSGAPPRVQASQGGIAAGGNVSPTASSGGIAVVSTAPVTIGITLEQYEAGLERKEQETRAELAQASAEDKDKIALLEKELTDVQAKLKNPEAALEEYKNKLVQAYQALDDLKQEIPLNQLEQAQQALAKGQSGDAEKLFQKVLSQGKEKAAEAAYQLAQLAYGRIDYAAAYQYFKEAADLQPDNPLYLNQAGIIAYTVGRYSEAEPLYQRSLAIREKTLGPDHLNVAGSLNNLALLYQVQGAYAKAEPLYQRSLAIREKTLGPDHLNVATSLNNLAGLYRAQGAYAKAEPLYQRSLAIREKVLGPDHPNVATSLNNLALLYRAQGAYAKAEPLYQRSLAIWEKALGPDHPDVATSLENYATLLRKLDRTSEAETMEVRAKAIRATR
jgi:tetratricopeptide (TPR) repeat protein